MKTIRDRTRAPIRVTVPGGRALFLGPAKTGQIPDQAAGGGAHGSSRGHPQHTVVLSKGNRGG